MNVVMRTSYHISQRSCVTVAHASLPSSSLRHKSSASVSITADDESLEFTCHVLSWISGSGMIDCSILMGMYGVRSITNGRSAAGFVVSYFIRV